MKLVPVLAFLTVSVMVVMIYQAVRQELVLRNLKARMFESSVELKQKEHAIIEEKNKIQDLNKQLTPLNSKKDQLNKKKMDILKSIDEMTMSLASCNTDKGVTEGKKAESTEALFKLNAEHEQAKQKAEEEIKLFKQQILDRDTAICAFLDETKEEGRKLCSNAKAKQ